MARSVCFGVNGRFILNLESKTWILALIPIFILLCNSDCRVWKLDLHRPVSQNYFVDLCEMNFAVPVCITKFISWVVQNKFYVTDLHPDFFIVHYGLSGMETRPIGRQVRYTTPTP
jgi:hypothetical protein